MKQPWMRETDFKLRDWKIDELYYDKMIANSDLYHIANKTYAGVRGFMNEQTRQARPEAGAANITRANRIAEK